MLEYIRNNGDVSYAEIERVFEQNGYDYTGNVGAYSETKNNVIFWAGWSETAFRILADLLKSNQIERVPCELLIYLIDGKCLDFPVLHSYSDLRAVHWLPCVFRAANSERTPRNEQRANKETCTK